MAGEVRFRLGPLILPGAADWPGVAGSEAVALFTDRARQADPGFVLDRDQARSVARLVTRLDGMPLAIELAAARVESLGVGPMLDRPRGTGRCTSASAPSARPWTGSGTRPDAAAAPT